MPLLVAVVLSILLASCSATRLDSGIRHVQGLPPVAKDLAQVNKETLARRYGEEWTLQRRSGPPAACLALSGGGIRSAAFSLGVLKAFSEKDKLDTFDIVSAVSGGAYALSWYYAAVEKRPSWPSKAVFGRPLNDLIGESWMSESRFVSAEEAAATAAWSLLLSPWNVFTNGVFGLHENTNVPAQAFYQRRIHQIFHGDRGARAPVLFGPGRVPGEPPRPLTLDDLRELLEKRREANRRLPFPVFVASVYFDDDGSQRRARFANRVFEFTPLRSGSDAFGYDSALASLPLSDVVATSGAAVDSTAVLGASKQTFLSMLNLDLGRYIRNFGPKATRRSWKDRIPFAHLFRETTRRDATGAEIYLTDGGHTDNLGVFPLVKRLCQSIVIVDAAHDPEYQFAGYTILRDALRSEMNVELAVPSIDDAVRGGRFRPPTTAMPGVIRSFPYPGMKNDTLDIHIEYIKLAVEANALARYSPTVECYYYLTRYPELAVDLTHKLERRLIEPAEARDIKVCDTAKAAVEAAEAAARAAPDAPASRKLLREPNRCTGDYWLWPDRTCAFPQESTANQHYGLMQFRAYCDLGYALGRSLLDPTERRDRESQACGPRLTDKQTQNEIFDILRRHLQQGRTPSGQ